jgi:predicted DNA-binding ribbon-helix-helix protein
MEDCPSTPVTRPLYFGCQTISITLENGLWASLDDICSREKTTLEAIVTSLSDQWLGGALPSALWQYAITYYRQRVLPVPGTARGVPDTPAGKVIRGYEN